MSAPSQIERDNKCHPQQPKRISRAPNAFFLYRSDFLKRGMIPPEVEKRQRHLSRIVGQCWKMLPDTEKAIWYDKAAALRSDYRFRHSSHNTGPFQKDKNRLSTKDKKKGSASNPRRSLDCQTQPPCYENVFSAFPSSASQTSLVFLPPAPEPSLSTLSLVHLVPSFASHTSSSSQDAFENSGRNEFGDLTSGPEVTWGGTHLGQDLMNPSETGSPQEPYTPREHERGFATCESFLNLEQLGMPEFSGF